MSELSNIAKGMTVVGADGANIGVVAAVVDKRIQLEANDVGDHAGKSRFIPSGLVAEVEGDIVRLSATGANAVLFDENEDGSMAD